MTKKRKIINWIIFALAVAVNVFILINACVEGQASSQESNQVAQVIADGVNAIKPNTITAESFPKFAGITRKMVGHFGLFGLSGILSTISIYNLGRGKLIDKHYWIILISLGFGFLVALLSELLQIFTPDRGASIADVGIDTAGYFLGVLVTIIVLLIIRRKKPINQDLLVKF